MLSHENTNGFIGPEWGRAFRWFREQLPLPKIAICHGTPQFYGQYDIDYTGPRLMEAIEPARLRMVEYSAGYAADHWCSKGHFLLCLEGELETELADGRRFTLKPGMMYQVADGAEPHRSATRDGARLYIVD